jgi:hypothetical protein
MLESRLHDARPSLDFRFVIHFPFAVPTGTPETVNVSNCSTALKTLVAARRLIFFRCIQAPFGKVHSLQERVCCFSLCLGDTKMAHFAGVNIELKSFDNPR